MERFGGRSLRCRLPGARKTPHFPRGFQDTFLPQSRFPREIRSRTLFFWVMKGVGGAALVPEDQRFSSGAQVLIG
ncbi:hypothetical protein [Sphingomonas pokkalii]|uniref:hypothetical protein n=1 Tax=Sphingomonas pokkalii TaxID=2175090 RepID=UPI00140382EE|nr:hypothetical protein [Sphingomonas pokkalii]